MLIIHWHIVGTKSLYLSLSFIGLLSVPSFSLLVPQVLLFQYACKSTIAETFGERQEEKKETEKMLSAQRARYILAVFHVFILIFWWDDISKGKP